jgi:hypothetical protein
MIHQMGMKRSAPRSKSSSPNNGIRMPCGFLFFGVSTGKFITGTPPQRIKRTSPSQLVVLSALLCGTSCD